MSVASNKSATERSRVRFAVSKRGGMIGGKYSDGFVIFRLMAEGTPLSARLMAASKSARSARSWRQRSIALAGALLILAGLVDLHGVVDAAHAARGGLGFGGQTSHDGHGASLWNLAAGGAFFPEASHPDEPLHAEPAREREVRSCVACLERLGSSATAPVRALGTTIDPPSESILAETPRHPERGTTRAASGRAPPRS